MTPPSPSSKRPIDWQSLVVLAIAFCVGFVPVVHALIAHLPFDVEPTIGLLLIVGSAVLAAREVLGARRAEDEKNEDEEGDLR